jgi:L-amino acid N-acyltransferase YncA
VRPPTAEVEVRAVEPADADALRAFFARVPEGDRTFFREDVLAPGVVERWLTDEAQQRSIAIIDRQVAGHVAVIRGVGWSSHVGEIRLVVDPERRRHGLGRLLAQRAVVDAVGQGMTKLVVEVVAEQEATVAMFSALGFEAEGLLRDHVRTASGDTHDLLVLAHFVEDLWASMTTTGVDEALGIDT